MCVDKLCFIIYKDHICVYRELSPEKMFHFLKDRSIVGIANVQERYFVDHSIPICPNVNSKWIQGYIQNKHMPNRKKMAMLTISDPNHMLIDWCA